MTGELHPTGLGPLDEVAATLPGIRRRLAAALSHVGATADGPPFQQTLDDIAAHYRQPHRRYHTLRHVADMLAHITDLAAAAGLEDTSAAVAACVWHDVIYDPTANGNEAASAQRADQQLATLGAPDTFRRHVRALIGMTDGHQPTPGDLTQAVMADADLATLAAAPDSYLRVNRAIRTEYGHATDIQWVDGRLAFIDSFLQRPTIYSTGSARRRWEAAARTNLRHERQHLQEHGVPL